MRRRTNLSESYLRKIIRETINEVILEDGEGGGAFAGGGGASNAAGVMQGGGINPGAGQYDVPMGSVQRRKTYTKFWDDANSRPKGNVCGMHDHVGGKKGKKK